MKSQKVYITRGKHYCLDGDDEVTESQLFDAEKQMYYYFKPTYENE